MHKLCVKITGWFIIPRFFFSFADYSFTKVRHFIYPHEGLCLFAAIWSGVLCWSDCLNKDKDYFFIGKWLTFFMQTFFGKIFSSYAASVDENHLQKDELLGICRVYVSQNVKAFQKRLIAWLVNKNCPFSPSFYSENFISLNLTYIWWRV